MSEKSSAESVEQVRRGMGNFLKSNVDRVGRMFKPEEDCPCHKKKED